MPTCTPGSTTTTFLGLCKPADGETNWGTAYRTSMDTIDTAIHNVGIPRSYLAGLQTTPTQASTSVSIAVGVAMGNDQATSITLTSTLVKILSSSWAVGTGNGGLYAATSIQGNQTYHTFVIIRTDTSVVDAFFDTSPIAANIPSPYTVFRRIASFKTDGNRNIQSYVQDGDWFGLATAVTDFNSTNPGTSAITRTLSVPSGLNLRAMLNLGIGGHAGGNVTAYLSDLAGQDQVPVLASVGTAPGASLGCNQGAGGFVQGQVQVRTNTSAAIRTRLSLSDGGTILSGNLIGWFDTRGRND